MKPLKKYLTEQMMFESFNSLKGIDDFKKLSLQDRILFCDYMNQQKQRINEDDKGEDIVYDEVDSIEDFLKENNAVSLEEAFKKFNSKDNNEN